MNYENIILEKKGGIAKITFNRPQKLNALSEQTMDEIRVALEDIKEDENIAVAVFTGAGRAFSAGLDLKEISARGTLGVEQAVPGGGMFEAVVNLGKPIIAAVNGLCYTGALELVLCCDMIVASEEAVFADTHARYGFVQGGGGSQRLPRLVGPMKAKEILLTSEPITAREAERIGLVNRVVPADKLEQTVEELASKIMSNAQTSVRAIKSVVDRGMKVNLEAGLQIEAEGLKSFLMALSEDSQARLKTFLGKEKK